MALLPGYNIEQLAKQAGAYTRPLFSSTWAISDTGYTLNNL